MSKIDAVRSALNNGGVPELVRRTRLWSAGRIYPGTMPEPRRPRPAARRTPVQPDTVRATASDVDHAAALAWFENRRPVYERLAAAVAPYVDPSGVFYDIGGNIGYFTKVLAEKTDFRGTVHLFEPVPNLAKLCAITLADVPYTAHIHEYGLSDADATLDLYISNDGNLGWNTMVAEQASAGMARTQIQVREFAAAQIGDVASFIKIDVEGAEHRVLAGLTPALATWPVKPVILCEIGWGTRHPDWDEELAAFGDLAAIGYRVVDLDGQPVDITSLTKTSDVLFLPS
jgi:FkbM family methyltransferase